MPIKTAASTLKASKRLADSPTQKLKAGRPHPGRSQEEFWEDDGATSEGHEERSRLLGSESPSGRTSLELGEDAQKTAQSQWAARYLPTALRLLAAGVLVTLLILGYKYLDVEAAVGFFKANPGRTLPLYFVCHVVSIVLFVPGAVPQMLAGFIFGFWLALPAAWAGTCLGSCLAFLAGRNLLKEWIANYVERKLPTFAAIERALFKSEAESWKLLLLLRSAPVLPDSVSNYALSITSLPFRTFALVSSGALVPYSILYVSMGSASSNLMDVLHHKGGSGGSSTTAIVTTVVSCVLGVMLFAYVIVVVKRAFKKVLDEQQAGAPLAEAASNGSDDGFDLERRGT